MQPGKQNYHKLALIGFKRMGVRGVDVVLVHFKVMIQNLLYMTYMTPKKLGPPFRFLLGVQGIWEYVTLKFFNKIIIFIWLKVI